MLTLDKSQLFGHIVEQHVNDAAFLWMQRAQAVNHAHHTAASIAKLDMRVDKHLKGLVLKPRQAWDYALEAADFRESGEIFVLAYLAFTSGEKHKVYTALDIADDTPETLQGFISALGWLPNAHVYPWLRPWMTSNHLTQRYLSVATCSVRRLDPQAYLTGLLEDATCLENPTLFGRALRLIGELKRHDLAPVLAKAQNHEHHQVSFWASWSALLLGNRSALEQLEPFALQPSPLQARAIGIAFRCLTHAQAWGWINQLNSDPDQTQQTAIALATLGDPRGVNWLLARMEEAPHRTVAGEAFSMITGADLEREGLACDSAAREDKDLEDAEDEGVPALDGYENLPVPDPNKVIQYWQQVRHRFSSSQRYLLGQPLGQTPEQPIGEPVSSPTTPQILRSVLSHGRQHQRLAAALEYALLNVKAPYANVKAPLHNKN